MGRFDRRLCVCVANLWRFQWLQRYSAWQRPIAWIPLHGQFPSTLFGGWPARLLATLAHQFEHVAARLSVHPARRQSRGRSPDLSQSIADDAARRAMARSELDLRNLGWNSRSGAKCGTIRFRSSRTTERTGRLAKVGAMRDNIPNCVLG